MMRVFLAVASLFFTTVTVEASKGDHVQALIEWLRSKEHGYFNEKLEIRQVDTKDHNSHYGVFAKEKINAKEFLLEVPDDCIIWGTENGEYKENICSLAEKLLGEMELGDKSAYAPYVNYLNEQSEGLIPATWSSEGKDVLQEIIQVDEEGGSLLPPEGLVTDALECGHDPDVQHAASLIISRGWESVLVPVYDMMNHHNGEVNTENTSLKGRKGFVVHAKKDVEAGEELFVSYDVCVDCEDTAEVWGTPEILRDFGFVEEYPQRWHIGENILDEKASFNINQKIVNGVPTYQVDWLGEFDEAGIKFFEDEYARLQELKEEVIEPARDSVPGKEMDIIIQYYDALMIAIDSALKSAKGAEEGTCGLELCDDEGIDAIEENIDNYYQIIYQCDTLSTYKGSKGMDHFKLDDTVQSHYQTIDYYRDPAHNDTCFHLDNIYQMCGCYWPHYHEMVVHKTAKYLKEDIKRVLWVGGGDSGLLNEIIKYPSLELVIGLELDQKVTRGAFKHFGSEPNYNNKKVQWWYGDASKSLLMLPSEYFGTFDMVLVDLSDTLFSLSVTDELDVVGALSLLLRPGGIFEMNELLFEKVSAAFKYALHYTYQDVPKVCDQSLVIASNDVDFLHRELTERDNIGKLLVETSSHKTKHQFDMVHDYRINNNSTFSRLCNQDTEVEEDPVNQETSPGIVMVVEAEQVSKDLKSIEVVKAAVVEALEKVGFNFLSSTVSEGEVGGAVVVLHEGYVIIRTFPEYKYCAFDIHLWSSFGKHEAAKKAVIDSVGGNIDSTTSYRIVAGGVFGVSTWKEDMKSRGPQVSQLCNKPEKSMEKTDAKASQDVDTDVILEEGLNLIKGEKNVAAVVCGHDLESCSSVDVIKKKYPDLEVIPLLACSSIKSRDLNFEGFMEKMGSCYNKVLKTLQGSLSKGGGKHLDAIIVDKSTPREMGEIVMRLFQSGQKALEFLSPTGALVMATIEDNTQSWQRDVVNAFRRDIFKDDPVFSAQILVGESTKTEVDITLSGDTHFIERLTAMVSTIKEKTGLTLEIRNIVGGMWRNFSKWFMDDSEASQFFLPGELQHPSLKRWEEQNPLGHQTVFQFDQGQAFEAGERVLGNIDGQGQWRLAEVRAVNDFNTYDLFYFDFGHEEGRVRSSMIRKLDRGDVTPHVLSSTVIEEAFKKTLKSMVSEDSASASLHVVDNVGEGYLIAALWSGGIAVALWDGRKHVDINLCTYEESKDIADEFANHFTKALPGLMLVLRDEQPRGTGSVVNFIRDIERSTSDPSTPYFPPWAIE